MAASNVSWHCALLVRPVTLQRPVVWLSVNGFVRWDAAVVVDAEDLAEEDVLVAGPG